jgi:hypothetical protein
MTSVAWTRAGLHPDDWHPCFCASPPDRRSSRDSHRDRTGRPGSRVEAPAGAEGTEMPTVPSRRDVANERVVRGRCSEPPRLRVMRAWPQGQIRSVDRRNCGPRRLSREIPQTPRRRRIDTMRKATSGTATARAVSESCAVCDPGTQRHISHGSWEVPCSPERRLGPHREV